MIVYLAVLPYICLFLFLCMLVIFFKCQIRCMKIEYNLWKKKGLTPFHILFMICSSDVEVRVLRLLLKRATVQVFICSVLLILAFVPLVIHSFL